MRNKLSVFLVLVLAAGLLAGCTDAQEGTPVIEGSVPEVEEEAPVEEKEAEEGTALLVGEMAYTMSQLEAMDTLEVDYTGKDDEVTTYTGVLVLDLLAEAGLEGETAVFIAGDGYEAELALAELKDCPDCVVAFDDGELRMVLPGFPGNLQVKGVVEIQVVGEAAPMEETALVVGEMAYTMSQLEAMDTLEVDYTGKDDEVTTYTGVLVLDLLAEAGLEGETAVFIAGDGYEAELALAELKDCPDCVVAFDDGELRMVLPGFPGNVQVKGVVELSVK